MAPHSSTLVWKIPWAEEPGRLQSMGSLRVGHDWATSLSLFTFMHWRRKWQPTPVFLPGESQGRGAWWAAVYGVAQSRTRLKWPSSSSSWNLKFQVQTPYHLFRKQPVSMPSQDLDLISAIPSYYSHTQRPHSCWKIQLSHLYLCTLFPISGAPPSTSHPQSFKTHLKYQHPLEVPTLCSCVLQHVDDLSVRTLTCCVEIICILTFPAKL